MTHWSARSVMSRAVPEPRRARFESQVLPHLDAAFRFARWLAPLPGEAEDLVQEAMLNAYRAFDGLRSADARAWLLTIVRNCHSRARQRQLRRAEVPLPEEQHGEETPAVLVTEADPERTHISLDETRSCERLLSHLSEQHREVLVLRELEELGYREIAAVIGVPIGTVMSRLARARAALRALWSQDAEAHARGMR